MQARVQWAPPVGVLGHLVTKARERAAALGDVRLWETRAASTPTGPGFGAALDSEGVSVIAELKRRSTSRGALNESLDPVQRARLYTEAGAAALSILTEPSEFGGDIGDLESVRAVLDVPLLRKDFLVHPVQLFEARVHGASAVLLIVRALGRDDTRIMAHAAAAAGLEALFEVRDESELHWALDAGARIIGVNRRNLETLAMEDAVLESLLPEIPPFLIAVAESGIATRDDVERTADLGADAVLVGSALSLASDPRQALANLASVSRRVGARA